MHRSDDSNDGNVRPIRFARYCEMYDLVWPLQNSITVFDGHDWRLTSFDTNSSRSCSFTHTFALKQSPRTVECSLLLDGEFSRTHKQIVSQFSFSYTFTSSTN